VRHKLYVAAAGCFLFGCSQSKPASVESRHLSAADEFHLQGDCVKLADKIEEQQKSEDLDENQEFSSNYKA
jgi:hypothetical protein